MLSPVQKSLESFDKSAGAWLEYVTSTAGRLRHEVILHHLRSHLAGAGEHALHILDVGGGTGELAADLAGLGHHVTLLDFSPAMLDTARVRCRGLTPPVTFVCAEASQIGALWPPAQFDVVLCHSLLEFVDDPAALLAACRSLLPSGGLLSVVVGNRYHTVLRAALAQGNLATARLALDAEIPATDLFGLPLHTFYPDDAQHMIEACGARVIGEYGVRVFLDLMKKTDDWDGLLALELAAGERLPYRRMARFIQLVAVT